MIRPPSVWPFPYHSLCILIPAGINFYPVLTTDVEVKSVEIEAGASLSAGANYNITLNGFTGAWVNAGTFTPGTGTVIFSKGNLLNVVTITGTTNFYNITVNANTYLQPQSGSLLRIAGTVSPGSASIIDLKATTNTIEYNGSGQSILNFQGPASDIGYYNLVINSTGTTTLPAVLNVANDFTLDAGTAAATASSTIDIVGNVILNAGTFTGSNSAISLKGNWTNNGATFTPGTSLITFNNTSADQAINGTSSSQTLYDVEIIKTSYILRVNGSTTSLTVNNITETSGNFTAPAALTINGSATLTAGTFTAGSASTTISGLVTLTAGNFIAGVTTNLAGNFANNGAAFITGTGTVNFNGSSAQSIGGINSFHNLTINNTAGVTASANQNVNGVLYLQSANASSTQGSLHMGSNTLFMGSASTTTGTGDVTGIVNRTSFLPNTPYSFGNQFTTINLTTDGTLPSSVSFKIVLTASHSWKTDAVNRYYDIIQTGCDDATRLTLNLHYLDAELNGATEGLLDFFDYHASGSLVHDHGHSNADATDNWVGLANLGLLFVVGSSYDQHYWTLGTNSTSNVSTWEGGSPSGVSDWTLPGNWDGGVPGATSRVVIPDVVYDPIFPALDTVGSVTIMAGGFLDASSGNTVLVITEGDGAWSNLGSFAAGQGTVEFTNSSATIAGTTDFNNVTVDDGAALTLGTNSIMRIAGTLSLSSSGVLNAANNHNTVEYNGPDQIVVFPNGLTPGYHNLILSGSGTKTMPSGSLNMEMDLTLRGTVSATLLNNVSVNGNLSIETGTTLNCSSYIISVGGNWSRTGTGVFSSGTGTVNFTGSSAQTITGANTFNNLTISGAGGVTAGADQTVNGILNLSHANPSSTKGLLEMTIDYTNYPGTTISDYLNSYLLNMGSSATTTGIGDVTGIIKRSSLAVNTPYTFGNQYTTIALTSGTMPTALSVSVTIGATPAGNPDAVARTYEIVPSVTDPETFSSTSTVSASFHYLDSELSSTLSPYHTNTEATTVTMDYDIGGGTSTPDEHGRSGYDFANNYIGLSNIPISYFIQKSGHVWRTLFQLRDFLTGYYTWNGSSSTAWGTPGNWTPSGTPADVSRIIIPDAGTTANDPVLPSGTTTINSITIEDGGILTMGSNTLTIKNSLSGGWEDQNLAGNDPATSKVIFSMPGTVISGNASFYDMEIGTGADITNEPGSTVKIGGTVTKTGTWDASTYSNTVEYNATGAQSVVAIAYSDLTLKGSGVKTFPAGTTTINGILSIEEDATAAKTGNIVLGNSSTLKYNKSTAFTAGPEWTNPLSSSGGVIISNTGKITIDADRVMGATTPLTINSGSSLEIGAGVNLAVPGTLTNNGGYTGLIIKSASNGNDGRLINNTAGVNATVELSLSGGLVAPSTTVGRFHYIVPPVTTFNSGSSIGAVMSSLGLTNFGGDLLIYDETKATPSKDNGWQYFDGWNSTTGFPTLSPASGYNIYLTDNDKMTFKGDLNSGSHSFILNYTSANPNPGWNLVGNPYPSNYDLSGINSLTGNNDGVDNTIYVTVNGSFEYRNIQDKNYVGQLSTDIIPPMQGFFVHATAPGSLFLPSSYRTIGVAIPTRSKGEASTIQKVKLVVSSGSLRDETLVCLMDDATTGFDGDHDAYKLFGSSTLNPDIYSQMGSVKYAINAVHGPVSGLVKVPVTVVVKSAGTYSISVSQFENLDGIPVVLRHGSVLTNLGSGITYTFTSGIGTFTDFELIFGSVITGTEVIEMKSLRTWYSNSFVYINCPSDNPGGISDLRIYDMQGKLVLINSDFDLIPSQTSQIPVSFGKGIYIVKLKVGTRTYTSKIVVV